MPLSTKEISAFAKECEEAVKAFAEAKGCAVVEEKGGLKVTPPGQAPMLVRLSYEGLRD